MSSESHREILGSPSEKFMFSEVSPDHPLRIDAGLSGLGRQKLSGGFREITHPSTCSGLRIPASLMESFGPLKEMQMWITSGACR